MYLGENGRVSWLPFMEFGLKIKTFNFLGSTILKYDNFVIQLLTSMLVSAPGLVVADVAGPDAVLPVVGGEAPGGVVTEVTPLLPVPTTAIVPVTVVASVWARPSETKSDVRRE